jgi:hypothetical protein
LSVFGFVEFDSSVHVLTAKRAVELDPLSPIITGSLAASCMYASCRLIAIFLAGRLSIRMVAGLAELGERNFVVAEVRFELTTFGL